MIRAFMFMVMMLLSTAIFAQTYEADVKESVKLWISGINKKLSSQQLDTITNSVYTHSNRRLVDPNLVFGIIKAESMYQPGVKSSANARGLMQVMPRWHADKIRGRNVHDIAVNIEVGVDIIADCLDRHKQSVNKALRCYSGGAGMHYNRKILQVRQELSHQAYVISKLRDLDSVDRVRNPPYKDYNRYEKTLILAAFK